MKLENRWQTNEKHKAMRDRRPPNKIKADSLGGRQAAPYRPPTFFFTKLEPSPSRTLYEILIAYSVRNAMSCVLFNYMEHTGLTPTQLVNFRPKCILGA